MSTEYSVLILDTDETFKPSAWTDNPAEGKFQLIIEPCPLKDAQETARGFNEKSLAARQGEGNNWWAIVTPAKAVMYQQGQTIKVESNYLLN
jgi:hypothetical protein